MGTVIQNSDNIDDDEDLNVDGDEPYGQSQYSAHDVIIPASGSTKEHNENLYLRKLVVGQEYPNNSTGSRDEAMDTTIVLDQEIYTNGENSGESSSSTKSLKKINRTGDTSSLAGLSEDNKNQIIEALKTKLREYEQQRSNNKCKCLICMDECRIPVVSICCWHVYCEECWLRTLGHRKLCPQCNMITSPTDLRRIYM